jgi:hypothetical protein
VSALSKSLRLATGNHLSFWCPGCNRAHGIGFGEGAGPRWGWNGSAEKPTFTPSILVRGSEMTEEGLAVWKKWLADGSPLQPDPEGVAPLGVSPGFEYRPLVCHSFVTDGRIQFLGDCTHALAGQTVDLPEWPNPEGDTP